MSDLEPSVLHDGGPSPRRPLALAQAPHRAAPIDLDALVRRVAALWAFESHVHADLRSDLIEELNELEHRVEVLRLRAESGEYSPADAVRDCARIYLRLRERWTGSVAA